MTKSPSNENVKREALKLRDVLLKYDRNEDANYLEQHDATRMRVALKAEEIEGIADIPAQTGDFCPISSI